MCGYFHISERSFSLIELLLVISIIALLMALLCPALNRGKEAARRAVCMSQLKQIGFAAVGYALENKDAIPNATLDWNTGSDLVDTLSMPAYAPYVGINPRIPTYGDERWFVMTPSEAEDFDGSLICPTADPAAETQPGAMPTYGRLYGGHPPYPFTLGFRTGRIASPMTKLGHFPHTHFIIADSIESLIISPHRWPFNFDWNGNGQNDSRYDPPGFPWAYNDAAPTRHLNSGNYLFPGGEAQTLPSIAWETNSELWTP